MLNTGGWRDTVFSFVMISACSTYFKHLVSALALHLYSEANFVWFDVFCFARLLFSQGALLLIKKIVSVQLASINVLTFLLYFVSVCPTKYTNVPTKADVSVRLIPTQSCEMYAKVYKKTPHVHVKNVIF